MVKGDVHVLPMTREWTEQVISATNHEVTTLVTRIIPPYNVGHFFSQLFILGALFMLLCFSPVTRPGMNI